MRQSQYPVFFSIVIPTYNRGKHISKAVNSILAQSFLDYEIVIVDDGSDDNTAEVVMDLSRTSSRIKYFKKKNEERSIARNYGIAQASGRYINFLDSDDIQYANHLATAYELLKGKSFPEVAHLGYELIDSSGKTLLVKNDFNESSMRDLIHENKMHGNAIFIRKDVADQIQFVPSPSAIVSEDWYVWLRLAARYPFYFDNKVTSAVVQHDQRSLMNINPDKLIASTEVIVDYLKRDTVFLEHFKPKVAYHFANHYTLLTLVLALTKLRKRDTIKYLMKAFRYDYKVIFRRRFLASLKHLLK